MRPLATGATIGIVGGGQLGRMLGLAALDLGFRVHVFAPPEADNVAFAIAHDTVEAPYEDAAAMARFAAGVDVLTYEFENVPVAALAGVETPIRPTRAALDKAQDRLTEKAFLAECGLPVGRHIAVDTLADLEAARAEIPDAILKARRLGYDGKGQTRVAPGIESGKAWSAIGGAPAILEARIDFSAETSVILVRGMDGTSLAYPMTENIHEAGILRRTRFPAPVSAEVAATAGRHVANVAGALDYVGVLAVEFFVTREAERPLVANEMAPRVHNTGHWTMDGAATSQFENHVRAIAGWPLGPVGRTADVTMENILGEDVESLAATLHNPAARPHVYGKRQARPGRKMAHVNFVADAVDFRSDRC